MSSVTRQFSITVCTTKAEEGHQISDFKLFTSDFGLQTSDFGLQTSDFRLQTCLPTSDMDFGFSRFSRTLFYATLVKLRNSSDGT